MTNHEHGMRAELKAAKYLRKLGFKIIDQNWKTKWCEIDCIAKKSNCVYFVEVKYRQNNLQGRGLDYITSKKIKQMNRAAEGWVQIHDWQGEYQTAVIEVSGEDFSITSFLIEI